MIQFMLDHPFISAFLILSVGNGLIQVIDNFINRYFEAKIDKQSRGTKND